MPDIQKIGAGNVGFGHAGSRFGAANSYANYTQRSTFRFTYDATVFELFLRSNRDLGYTLQTSDGSLDSFTSTVYKTFPDERTKISTINTDAFAVDILNVRSAGLTSLNGPDGTADLTSFPGLVLCQLSGTRCTRFIADLLYGLTIDGTQAAGKVLDVTEVNANELRAPNSNCRDVKWPRNGTRLGAIVLGAHAIDTPQKLTAMPVLNAIYMDANKAPAGQGIGRLDLTLNPQLTYLSLREARINDIDIADPSPSLGYVDLVFNDFSKSYNGVPGDPRSVLRLIVRAPNLSSLIALHMGLDADTLEAILTHLVSTKRVPYLALGQSGSTQHYLNPNPIYPGRPNEPLVTLEAQQKLAAFRAQGGYIEINDPVFQVTLLTHTTAQIDFISGKKDITWFKPGDQVRVNETFNSDLFNTGEHTVLSGSGKSFIVTNYKKVNSFNGATGTCTLVKPVNYAGMYVDNMTGALDVSAMPTIGDLNFRVEARVNLQGHIYGNFIGGNTNASLEAFCIFQRNGELIAYCQAGAQGKGIFRPINTPEQAAVGTWIRVGYERIGDTIYGLLEGQRVWAQQVGAFTIDPLTVINISYRGGGGGGVDTQHYLDWFTLEIATGPNGELERWLDFQYNDPTAALPVNQGKLGGVMGAYTNMKYIEVP
jgi:hypothetical protein